jgi:hypothetical protein
MEMTIARFELKINSELFGSVDWDERVGHYICEVGPTFKVLPTKKCLYNNIRILHVLPFSARRNCWLHPLCRTIFFIFAVVAYFSLSRAWERNIRCKCVYWCYSRASNANFNAQRFHRPVIFHNYLSRLV